MVIGLLPQVETFKTENGEIASLTLPDNSQVTLNAGSQVVYSGNRFNTRRKIQLTGEAYFKVTKGNTFSVVTTEGTVTVLGTTFNVRSRDEKLSVFCYTGKVKVSDPFKAVYLTKGEKRLNFQVKYCRMLNQLLLMRVYNGAMGRSIFKMPPEGGSCRIIKTV